LFHVISAYTEETAVSRVLSSNEAQQAIGRMQQLINSGLMDQIAALNNEGTVLSDPNVWDGRLATEFRNQVWPDAKRALDTVHAQLVELRNRTEKINADIMTAGGNA
jgi:hypothetical protein